MIPWFVARRGMRNVQAWASGSRPAVLVVVAFGIAISVGTLLLSLPIASDGARPPSIDVLFTATSAVTVTGLGVVPMDSWSVFGEVVIMGLIQIGGFGIMTLGSVLALVVLGRFGLRQRILTRTEIGDVDPGALADVVRGVALFTLTVELVTAVVLAGAFRASGAEDSVGAAAYSGLFHAVAAFNNAGFSLYPDNLEAFVTNPFVVLPTSAAFIIGGLGFPVLLELLRRAPRRRWSLHTKLTLAATAVLLVLGPLVVLTFEWDNPDTLGPLGVDGKALAAWFQGVTPRTAGFNTVDIGALHQTTLVVMAVFMFIGAGSASTSGGIKVTTVAVLISSLGAELRGDREVSVFRRRLPATALHQALSVATLSALVVFVAALVLMARAGLELIDALFQATSAFGTTGLDTGVTAALPASQLVLVMALMFTGRVGPVTLGTALLRNEHDKLYRYPEERPIIG